MNSSLRVSVVGVFVIWSFISWTRPSGALAFVVGNQVRNRFFLSRLLACLHEEDLTPASEEDMKRWEAMYEAGEKAEAEKKAEFKMNPTEVRIVTFDLDNTLWNTTACIDAANDALADYLKGKNISFPKRVEVVMNDLFKLDKLRYCPMAAAADQSLKPVLLTDLRKDAIRFLLEEHNKFTPEDSKEFADNAFECWTKARHDAIPQNYASCVVESLRSIQALKSSGGERVLIGAITDGNSDPSKVPELNDIFDFCVNAEAVGVSKPDKRIYLEAAKEIVRTTGSRYISRSNANQDWGDEGALEEAIGPTWIHVGDDFVKDVVAAKSLKMRTIWATELVRSKDQSPKETTQQDDPAISEEERLKALMNKVSSEGAIKMQIGSDSYLADSIQREFVDAEAYEFSQLPELLRQWHTDAERHGNTGDDINGVTYETPNLDLVSVPPESQPTGVNQPRRIVGAVFRLKREDFSVDVPVKIRGQERENMKDILLEAQKDKSSGVFSFPESDVSNLRNGKAVLFVRVGNTGLQFTRDTILDMTVQDIVELSEENPIVLTLEIKKAPSSPGFDLF